MKSCIIINEKEILTNSGVMKMWNNIVKDFIFINNTGYIPVKN